MVRSMSKLFVHLVACCFLTCSAVYVPETSRKSHHSSHRSNVDHTHNNQFGSIWDLSNDSRTIDADVKFARRLVRKLLTNYNKEIVIAKPLILHTDVLLLQLKNTNERDGTFESVISLMIEWKDLRMRWNPLEFNNLTFISLTTDQVWLPDIAMINAADHLYSISRDSRFNVRVTSNGLFRYVPTGTARTWCNLKLISFPFDIQQCALEIESWSLDSSSMTFDGISDILVDADFVSGQFELCDHYALTYQHTYNFTGETFSRVKFLFTVKRKGAFYVINLIFPITILSFIQTLGFLIPCKDTTTDRTAFGTTNLLTLVVYQTIITEQLPKSSDAITALSKYVITLIVISAVGIFESILTERIYYRTQRPPPPFLMHLLKRVPVLMRESPADRERKMSQFYEVTLPRQYSTDNSSTSSPFLPPKKRVTLHTYGTFNSEASSDNAEVIWQRRKSPSVSCLKGSKSAPAKILGSQASACSCFGSGISTARKNSRCPKCNKVSPKVQRIGGKNRRFHSRLSNTVKVAKTDKNRGIRGRTSIDDVSWQWNELAFKIDYITYILTSISALAAPIIIFLPLLIESNINNCYSN